MAMQTAAYELARSFGQCKRKPLTRQFGRMRTRTASRFSADLVSESLLEVMLHQAVELLPWIQAAISQPFTTQVRGPDGSSFDYTPDALLFADGRWTVVECKPAREYLKTETAQRLEYARTHFDSKDLRFVVIDEFDVGGRSLQENLARIWRVRKADELDARAHAASAHFRDGLQESFSHLISLGHSAVAIDRALCLGLLHCDLSKPKDEAVLQRSRFGDWRDLLHKLRSQSKTQDAAAFQPIPGVSA